MPYPSTGCQTCKIRRIKVSSIAPERSAFNRQYEIQWLIRFISVTRPSQYVKDA